jgi:hypothetical protein
MSLKVDISSTNIGVNAAKARLDNPLTNVVLQNFCSGGLIAEGSRPFVKGYCAHVIRGCLGWGFSCVIWAQRSGDNNAINGPDTTGQRSR